MRVKIISNDGETGVINCTLGEVPILRLLKYRCPELRIEVELDRGGSSLVAIKDIELHQDELTKLNKEALPHLSG